VIPSAALRDSITIEPYLGESALGPTYGTAVTIPAMVSVRRSTVALPDGRAAQTILQVLIRPGTEYKVGSRVTTLGKTLFIFDSQLLTELARDFCWQMQLGWGAA